VKLSTIVYLVSVATKHREAKEVEVLMNLASNAEPDTESSTSKYLQRKQRKALDVPLISLRFSITCGVFFLFMASHKLVS